jgi:deoxyribodipyrimidine photolyase
MKQRADQDQTQVIAPKFPLQRLFMEFLSIVLGVLLALALNEWRENRSHQSQANAALFNIKNELQSNLRALTTLHENNVETVKLMSEDPDAESGEERKFIPGLQLRQTAWETFLSTNISNYVDYKTVLTLSETYSMQSVYKHTGSLLAEAAMNMAAYAAATANEVDDANFQRQFYDYFVMLVQVEDELLKSCQKSIEHLEVTSEEMRK